MTRYITASPSQGQLEDRQIQSWREQGYVFVSDLLPETLTNELSEAATDKFPAPDSVEASRITDFGSNGALTFPSQTKSLNNVTLHPALLSAVASLLAIPVTDLRLTQSDLWPKYGPPQDSSQNSKPRQQNNSDQRIHVDYPNHTLAHPAPWHRPEAVELILYLSDWQETAGSTAIVPRSGAQDPAYRWPIVDSPGIADLDYINDRQSAEQYFKTQRPHLAQWRESLYEREVQTQFKAGDIIFYRHDTWHRGTPLNPGTLRLAHNMTFRRADAEWISTLHTGWAWQAYRKDKYLERLIATATLEQRAVLGFPQPGSTYWCEETLQGVAARYEVFGMDMTPYREALAKSASASANAP